MTYRSKALIVAALGWTLGGCTFVTNTIGRLGKGADGAAFTADLSDYEIESIAFAFEDDTPTSWCPGQSRSFAIHAQAHEHKDPGKTITMETRLEGERASDSVGKIDFLEFALGARGGEVRRGSFQADGDPFANLLGYDLKAAYARDNTKAAALHFDPEYSCIRRAGASGLGGSQGRQGSQGSGSGGAGGTGGPGGKGRNGRDVTAHVSIVATPLYDRVGIVRLGGGSDQLTLFDLARGITIASEGGRGGRGGKGGDGGKGADPEGQGGAGGSGGEGGPGGDGGTVRVVLDQRYPELDRIVKVSVAGGSPGSAGRGGYGGPGGPAAETCADCETRDPGPDGPGGPDGVDGTQRGADGRYEVAVANVSAAFSKLPAGVRLLDDPQPAPAPAGNKPTNKGKKKKHRRRR